MQDAKQSTSGQCKEWWNLKHVAEQEARQLQTGLEEVVSISKKGVDRNLRTFAPKFSTG